MDEGIIFLSNYFSKTSSEKLAERFKQMKIEEEAPVIIMDMTRALGFRDDCMTVYSLFVKEVRDGKLGNYTLDTLTTLTTIKEIKELLATVKELDNSLFLELNSFWSSEGNQQKA